MANLNILGQDVANKRERKLKAAHIVAKCYPPMLSERVVTVLLLKSTPLLVTRSL